MSGIAGFLHPSMDLMKRQEEFQNILKKMNEVQKRRGRDDEGIYLKKGCGMAHVRLAILDLETGHQPFIKRMGEREYSIVFDGEIYNKNDLKKLKESGLSRYHCNLESSENYFKNLCSTHKFSQKIAVIKAAKEAGLEICSGGIIGMGESMEDRADLALTLKDLEVTSVPLNILHPIPGTPLEKLPLLSDAEILKTIALFRFILPKAYLRLAGGRARLSEQTLKQALYAGINSAIVGDLLTTLGSDIDTDKKRFKEAGYEL